MENLEDVSSGGRVTRALRKRLTSIDSSDTGSRSSTPIQSKLTAISELNSPIRSTRMSRRNSMSGISTPVKTPSTSKTIINAESNETLATPIRRSTRKRSNSTTEESVSTKSHMVKFDELLEEQDDEPTTTAAIIPTKRTTRSQSQSPPQLANEKISQEGKQQKKRGRPKASVKVKMGPRSRRSRILSESDTDNSDTEIIILEDEDGQDEVVVIASSKKQNNATRTSPRLSSNKKKRESRENPLSSDKTQEQEFDPIDLVDDISETHQDQELMDDIDSSMCNTKTPTKLVLCSQDGESVFHNTSAASIENDKQKLKTTNLLESPNEIHKIQDESINEEIAHLQEIENSEKTNRTPECSKHIERNSLENITKLALDKSKEEPVKDKSLVKTPKNDASAEKELNDSVNVNKLKEESKSNLETSRTGKLTKIPVCIKSVVRLEKLSPETICKLTSGKDNTELSSPKKKRTSNSKSVAFNEKEEGEIDKCVYPKTPTLTKSKSYVDVDTSTNTDDKSFQSDEGSTTSFKDTRDHVDSKDSKLDDSKESEDFHAATNNQEENGFDLLLEKTPHKPNLISTIQSSTPVLESFSKFDSEEMVSKMGKLVEVEVTENIEIEMPEKLLLAKNKSPVNDSKVLRDSETAMSVVKHDIEKSQGNTKTDESAELKPEGSKILNNIDLSTNEKVNEEPSQSSFSKSWSQNVSGKASSNEKIDTISLPVVFGKDDLNLNKNEEPVNNIKDPKESNSSKSDLKINESAELNVDDESMFDVVCEMVEDEAVEVNDDYESGDSMDSEERREIEDNQIVENGESIGSSDTAENTEEEEGEENASFVTSDSEDMLLEYSDDEDLNASIEFKQSSAKTKVFNVASSESESENLSSGVLENNSQQALTSEVNKMIDTTFNDDVKDKLSEECTSKSPNEISLKDEVNKLNESDALQLANKSDEDEVVPKKNLSNVSNSLTKDDREKNVNMSIKTIETSSSDDEEGDQLSFCQSLSVQRAEVYESSDEDSNSNKNISRNEGVMKVNSGRRSIKVSQNEEKTNQDAITQKSSKSLNISKEETCNADIKKRYSLSNSKQNSNFLTISHNNDENHKIIGDIQTDGVITYNENVKNESLSNAKCINSSRHSDVPDNSTKSIDSDNYSEDDTVIPETQQDNNESNEKSSEQTKTENCVLSFEEDNSDLPRKRSGLSKSFSQCKSTKDDVVCKRVKHNSFTIGVTVTKTKRHDERNSDSDEDATDNYNGNNGNDYGGDDNEDDDESAGENNVKPKINLLSSDEEQELAKLSIEQTMAGKYNLPGRMRQSLASHSVTDKNTSIKKCLQRKSMYALNTNFDPSKSLVECLEECKHELHKQSDPKKRLSKSFTGTTEELAISKEDKVDDIYSNFEEKAPETNKKDKSNRMHILERCDEILDAANRAKLEAKLNYKKSKVIKPKDRKTSKSKNKNDQEIYIPKQTKKEMKQSKDKTKLALKQAIRASAQILMNESSKRKKEKPLPQFNEEKWEEKRLPMELLNTLSSPKEKNKKENKESTNTEQPYVQLIKSTSGDLIEEILSPPRKKKTVINTFELPTGIVFEEPVTPKKEKIVSGFRVSPITPRTVGFKVRHILTAGQDKPPTLPSFSRAERKRKLRIEEPKHTLPKPKWSQSGIFIEEVISNTREISRAGATEFLVSGLNRSEKSKSKGLAAGTAAANALNFKNATMNRNNYPRETTHEALMRKARQVAHRHF